MLPSKSHEKVTKTTYSMISFIQSAIIKSKPFLYLFRENLSERPKSCVVVGYELDERSGIFFCML